MEIASQFAAQKKDIEIQLNTYFNGANDLFLSCGFEGVAVIPNWKYGLDCYLLRRRDGIKKSYPDCLSHVPHRRRPEQLCLKFRSFDCGCFAFPQFKNEPLSE